MRMRIVGVLHPGGASVVEAIVGHGQHPKLLLWRKGFLIQEWLTALTIKHEVQLTALVTPKTALSRRPKTKHRKPFHDTSASTENPKIYQRISAYAVVRSHIGVLGTECSDRTLVPGMWHLPGGGLNPGESPADAVNREMAEETGQIIRINKLVDVQSDHWIGQAPSGYAEDFHALRIIYTAECANPTKPSVIDIDGTTSKAEWIPVRRWRKLTWTSGSRSALERFLNSLPA